MSGFKCYTKIMEANNKRYFPRAAYLSVIIYSLMSPKFACAEKYNSVFLRDKTGAADLKPFEVQNDLIPGTYRVDIFMNSKRASSEDISFVEHRIHDVVEVKPEITLALLQRLGADVARLKDEGMIPQEAKPMTLITIEAIPGVSVDYDPGTLVLNINFPQAYIRSRTQGYVDPSLWDDGIAAAFTNYQLNLSRNQQESYQSDYLYLNLRNGINLGAWHLRNDSALSQSNDSDRHYSSNRTWLARDITALKSTMAMGQLFTGGTIFDSVRLRGASLGSDTGMLPADQVGYAPVVRGIAETRATVEVRQNGYVIYSTTVPAGAFAIRDIFPGGSNGDLEITIIEADGRRRLYTQAYSYLPIMTRRGNFQYGVSVGKYDNDPKQSPTLMQAELVYGLSDNVTSFGGIQTSERYLALNAGLGLNSPFGGVSVDVTQSHAKDDRRNVTSGQSLRFLYSKTLAPTDTTFTMAGYRYSTSGYRTLNEHVAEHQSEGISPRRLKNRLDLTVNQSLGRISSVFLTTSAIRYWNAKGETRSVQLGFNSSLGRVSYNLSGTHTTQAGRKGRSDNSVAVSFSVPLGANHAHRIYSSLTSGFDGKSSLQAGASGYIDEQGALTYNVQGGHYESSHSLSAGIDWESPTARLGANYATSGSGKQIDASAAGSIVLHSGGLTFGQPTGETFALVEVPKVKGAGIENSHLRTDGGGYAVYGYVQPYRYNWLNLDTETLGSEVEVEELSAWLVPRRGSITRASFKSSSGRRVQFVLKTSTGLPVPLGARVHDAEHRLLGVVDNQSRVLAFGLPERGKLQVLWGEEQCSAPFRLDQEKSKGAYDVIHVACR